MQVTELPDIKLRATLVVSKLKASDKDTYFSKNKDLFPENDTPVFFFIDKKFREKVDEIQQSVLSPVIKQKLTMEKSYLVFNHDFTKVLKNTLGEDFLKLNESEEILYVPTE